MIDSYCEYCEEDTPHVFIEVGDPAWYSQTGEIHGYWECSICGTQEVV